METLEGMEVPGIITELKSSNGGHDGTIEVKLQSIFQDDSERLFEFYAQKNLVALINYADKKRVEAECEMTACAMKKGDPAQFIAYKLVIPFSLTSLRSLGIILNETVDVILDQIDKDGDQNTIDFPDPVE